MRKRWILTGALVALALGLGGMTGCKNVCSKAADRLEGCISEMCEGESEGSNILCGDPEGFKTRVLGPLREGCHPDAEEAMNKVLEADGCEAAVNTFFAEALAAAAREGGGSE